LIPPAYVKPYVKRQKNDATDADSICEAVTRANMRFVPTKTPEQQSGLVLHRTRHLFIRQQTAVINAIRAHLAEFGIVAQRRVGRLRDGRGRKQHPAGNPSGATALSLDGTQYKAKDGSVVFIEGYTLPVNYPEFERGYQEDTIGPFMLPGPRQVDASVTASQAGPYEFDLEMWNGRYHSVSLGSRHVGFVPMGDIR
jgi:hypothetical protein